MDKTKLEELKKKTQPTEEELAEIATLETQVVEESERARYDELVAKDENDLESAEVDELISLGEKFKDKEGKPDPEEPEPKKYAGIYETPEKLIEGLLSSEQERKRIADEMAKDPTLAAAVGEAYKESQRKVTKLVADKKTAPRSRKPLYERELEEMTPAEYEVWEKSNKLEAHAWLTQATSRSVQVTASRRNVFRKYPGFLAEIQGIVEPSKELREWDRIDKEEQVDRSDPLWPEKIMAKMEANLGIKAPASPKKHVSLKPGLEQGRSSAPKSVGKKVSDEEYEAMTDDERQAHLESQKPK